MSTLHIDVLSDNIEQNPQCFHGPTLKFCKRGVKSEEFFACSACRDRKFCSFYCKVGENYKNQTKRAVLARSKFVKGLKYKSYIEKLKKLKKEPRERRGYCQTCNVLFDAQIDDMHSQCRKLVGLSKRQLLFPTEICIPNENDKVEAQYLFDKSTTKFIISSIKLLGVDHVLCIGTPRLHEHLINSKMSSLLLDFDPKYHNFYSRKNFVWYNMFNHFTFDNRRMKTVCNFLAKEGRLVILLDPPFGGRVEPIVETLKKINREHSKTHQEVDEAWVMWFFPYFMERHIQDSLPNFKMMDYHVNYENHESFSDVGPRRRKFGSPVRIFTNIPLNSFDLSAVPGYKFCFPCDYWVSDNNRHCDSCKTCTSKNGMQYVHCEKCGICVKPSYEHCETCGRCCLKSHVCGQFKPDTNCYHCHLPGHKRSQCPTINMHTKKKKIT